MSEDDQLKAFAHFLDRAEAKRNGASQKPKLPSLLDPADPQYALTVQKLEPLVEEFAFAWLSAEKLRSLLLTVFWIGKED